VNANKHINSSPQAVGALSRRQAAILQQAREIGYVSVADLAHRYEVTSQSIRRDLDHISKLQLLQRVHGGGVICGGVANLGYQARRNLATQAKRRIGRAVAAMIPNHSSLFINIGTTTEEVARQLTAHSGLLVITNNVNVINILYPCKGIEVVTASGIVRREDGGIVGDAAALFAAQYKVDYAVIGASAVDMEGALLDYDYREVRVTHEIISNSREVILAADAMKFDRRAPVRIGSIGQVHYLVTDSKPPRQFLRACRDHSIQIKIAPDGAGD